MTGEVIFIIGGTTEANLAAARLESEGYSAVVSVATQLGESLAAGVTSTVETGRKTAGQMAEVATTRGAAAIVDCSHPFALEVSAEARRAADFANIPYFRYTRAASPAAEGAVIHAASWQEALDALKERGGRSFLTVGTRNLAVFVEAGLAFTARILPTVESLEECARLEIPPADIIAAYPPYSVDFTRACLRRAGASTMVTKDSGLEGGLPQKLEAAAAERVSTIIVARPGEPEAIEDLDELIGRLAAVRGGKNPRTGFTAR